MTILPVMYNSVQLTWSPTGSVAACAIEYIITTTPLNGGNPWTNVTNGTTFVVDRLEVNQSYNFTVMARNRAGTGGSSRVITCTVGIGMMTNHIIHEIIMSLLIYIYI